MKCAALFLLAFALTAHAQPRGLPAASRFTLTIGELAAGAALSFGVHEGGHQLMAEAAGVPIRWRHGEYDCGTDQDGCAIVATGGFGAQAIASELLMDLPAPKSSPLVLGFLGFYIVNSAGYVLANEIKGGGSGDFSNWTPAQQRVVELGLLAHVALTAYRLVTQRDALPAFIDVAGADVRLVTRW